MAYNPGQIERLRKKILDDPIMWKHYNATPTGLAFDQFVVDVGKLLGDSVPPAVLEESCMPILGKELTRRRMNAFALRIAANVGRLRKGEVVMPWTRQVEDEWAPVEVLKCWPGRNRKGDMGHHFQFLVLAGSPVGFVLERFWSNTQAHYIAAELGFSGKKDRPLVHPAYMVRLRFSALFEVALSPDRQPGLPQGSDYIGVGSIQRAPDGWPALPLSRGANHEAIPRLPHVLVGLQELRAGGASGRLQAAVLRPMRGSKSVA